MLKKKESTTAKICAYIRAYHIQKYTYPIFNDSVSFTLLGQKEFERIKKIALKNLSKISQNNESLEQLTEHYIEPIILPRAKFTEDELQNFKLKHEKIQYVVLGAGLDTFIFRNQNPNIFVYELDHPNTQKYKQKLIKKSKLVLPINSHIVPINFETQTISGVLNKHNFNSKIPTFYSMLGVLYYISKSAFNETIKNISKISPSGSVIVFDYPIHSSPNSKTFDSRSDNLKKSTSLLGEEMKCAYSLKDIKTILENNGFKISKQINPHTIQQDYLNPTNKNYKAYNNISFIMATKN